MIALVENERTKQAKAARKNRLREAEQFAEGLPPMSPKGFFKKSARYALNFLSPDAYYEHFTKWQFAAIDAKKRSSAVSLFLALDSNVVKADPSAESKFKAANTVLKDEHGNAKYCLRTAQEKLEEAARTGRGLKEAQKYLQTTLLYFKETKEHMFKIPWDPDNTYETGMSQVGASLKGRNAMYAAMPALNKYAKLHNDISAGRLTADELSDRLKETDAELTTTTQVVRKKYIYETKVDNAIMDSFMGQRLGYTAWPQEWGMGFVEREVSDEDYEEARRNFANDPEDRDLPIHKQQLWNLEHKGLRHFHPGQRARWNYRHPDIPLTSHQKWAEAIWGGGMSGGDAKRASGVFISEIEDMLTESLNDTGSADYDGALESIKWLVLHYSSNEIDEETGLPVSDRSNGIPFDLKQELSKHFQTLQQTNGNIHPWTEDFKSQIDAIRNIQNNFSGANVIRFNWKNMAIWKRLKRFIGDIISERVSSNPNENADSWPLLWGVFGNSLKGSFLENIVPKSMQAQGIPYHALWPLHKGPTTLWHHGLRTPTKRVIAPTAKALWKHKGLATITTAIGTGAAYIYAPVMTATALSGLWSGISGATIATVAAAPAIAAGAMAFGGPLLLASAAASVAFYSGPRLVQAFKEKSHKKKFKQADDLLKSPGYETQWENEVKAIRNPKFEKESLIDLVNDKGDVIKTIQAANDMEENAPQQESNNAMLEVLKEIRGALKNNNQSMPRSALDMAFNHEPFTEEDHKVSLAADWDDVDQDTKEAYYATMGYELGA